MLIWHGKDFSYNKNWRTPIKSRKNSIVITQFFTQEKYSNQKKKIKKIYLKRNKKGGD